MESILIAQAFVITFDLMVALALWLNYNNLRRSYLAFVICAAVIEVLRQVLVLGIIVIPDSSLYYWGAGIFQYTATVLLLAGLQKISSPDLDARKWVIVLLALFAGVFTAHQLIGFTASVLNFYIFYLPLLLVSVLIVVRAGSIGKQWSQGRAFLVMTTVPLLAIRIAIPSFMADDDQVVVMYFLESLLFGITLGAFVVYAMEEMHRHIHLLLAERIQAENDLQFILDESADAVIVTDDQGIFITWNRRSEEQFGYSEDEAVGKLNIRQLLTDTHPQPALSESIEFEDELKHRDGHAIPIKVRVQSTLRNDRKLCVYIVQDLSVEKELSRQREIMEQRLHQSQKLESLGVLAGGVAHDFNNLLATISGYADIARFDDGKNLQDHLKQISVAVEKASQLTDQMLTYAGQGRYDPCPIELNETAEEMLVLLKASISKKAKLSFEPSEGEFWFKGESGQIDQVLMNLITNASESLVDKVGQIIVSTGTVYVSQVKLSHCLFGKEMRAGEFHYVSVADTGYGMGKETLTHLFEPFFTTKFLGRGLGLATVAGIVKRHNAALEVESQLINGSKFTVYFQPCEKPEVKVPEVKENYSYPGKLKILVMDDEAAVLRMCRDLLERKGFEVVPVVDGEMALEVFHAVDDIDLLLFDCTLPTLSGFETYEKILDSGKKPPVIFFSGYTENQLSDSISSEWPALFIHKPFKQETLLGAIADLTQNI